MNKPRLLDLFCGAGGASAGYARAGFDVTGVDRRPQPHYPYRFIQADALTYLAAHGGEYDAIHASPPCQKFSAMRKGIWPERRQHPDLIGPVRNWLNAIGAPYVIENVPGAPLITPFILCGTMFGLETKDGAQLRRRRLFESSIWLLTPPCRHNPETNAIGVHGGGQHPARRRVPTVGVYGHSGGSSVRDPHIPSYRVADRRDAMGIDWMNQDELSQAIPPAYTAYIGAALIGAL